MFMLIFFDPAILCMTLEQPLSMSIPRRIFFRDGGNHENDETGLSHCYEFVIDKLINKNFSTHQKQI